MWLGFAVLAFLGICVQTALAPQVEILTARPDVMLLLAVFYALHGRGYDGLLVAWTCGILVDLSSQAPLGLFACVYALAGMLVFAIREAVFRDRLATHALVTLICAALSQLALAGYVAWRYPLAASAHAVYLQALASAVYTTALVPIVHGPLLRYHRLLGLRRPTESDARGRRPRGTV